MEPGLSLIKQHMTALNIPAAASILDELLLSAQGNNLTYQEFLYQLVVHEVTTREKRRLEKQLKLAAFPEYQTLETFDISEQKTLSQKQLNQLKELHWLEQAYNLFLLGPPGVGNYRKFLLMERNKNIICIYKDCTFISFHNNP